MLPVSVPCSQGWAVPGRDAASTEPRVAASPGGQSGCQTRRARPDRVRVSQQLALRLPSAPCSLRH